MIAEAGAAIGGIKAAIDIAKGLAALKSEAEINQAIIDIQRVLLDAQAAAFDDKQAMSKLSDEIAALKGQLARIGDWEAEKQRYALTQSLKGPVTYDLRPEFAKGEIFHRICVTCFGVEKKSILHTLSKHSSGEIVKCPVCNIELTLSDFDTPWGAVGTRRSFYDELDE